MPSRPARAPTHSLFLGWTSAKPHKLCVLPRPLMHTKTLAMPLLNNLLLEQGQRPAPLRQAMELVQGLGAAAGPGVSVCPAARCAMAWEAQQGCSHGQLRTGDKLLTALTGGRQRLQLLAICEEGLC